jgi:activator of 2-hydroxyglutaryl-CoA dehydratase
LNGLTQKVLTIQALVFAAGTTIFISAEAFGTTSVKEHFGRVFIEQKTCLAAGWLTGLCAVFSATNFVHLRAGWLIVAGVAAGVGLSVGLRGAARRGSSRLTRVTLVTVGGTVSGSVIMFVSLISS